MVAGVADIGRPFDERDAADGQGGVIHRYGGFNTREVNTDMLSSVEIWAVYHLNVSGFRIKRVRSNPRR
ncbi:hypothetical protein GCM10010201_23740 [Pilimelia columellifera subsp. columellifera]|uniref:Uncharacterized protein n=1 Tax=Pilimelia columellifera subsp. columellifera TaxID=706583 RepID=A0ABN3NK18_9ACTN